MNGWTWHFVLGWHGLFNAKDIPDENHKAEYLSHICIKFTSCHALKPHSPNPTDMQYYLLFNAFIPWMWSTLHAGGMDLWSWWPSQHLLFKSNIRQFYVGIDTAVLGSHGIVSLCIGISLHQRGLLLYQHFEIWRSFALIEHFLSSCWTEDSPIAFFQMMPVWEACPVMGGTANLDSDLKAK